MNIRKFFNLIILSILVNPSAYSFNGKRNANYFEEKKKSDSNFSLISKNKLAKIDSVEVSFADLKKLILENNERLKKYRSRISQSKFLLNSKKSAWAPKLNLSSDDLPSFSSGISHNKLSTNTETYQSKLALNGTVEWDIIKPNRRLEINIARDDLKNAEYNYKFYEKDIYLQAVKKYFLIQSSLQDIKISKKAIDISLVSLKEAENRFTSGIGNKLDLLESKTQLGREQIRLKKREGQLNFHKSDLAKILNIKKPLKIIQDENPKILGIWNLNNKESLSLALNNRNDIKIEEKKIKINQNKALSLISGKKPTLSIYNTYSLSTSNGESGVENPNHANVINSNSNKVGLKFGLNLFDGGLLRQNYKSLKNKETELIADLNEKKLEIKNQINNALINLEIAKSNIIISFDQVQSANESLNISLKRLEAGLTTQREIVNLQGDVSEAESNYINAIKDYNENLFTLVRAVGIDNFDFCASENEKIDTQNLFIKFVKEKNILSCKNLN